MIRVIIMADVVDGTGRASVRFKGKGILFTSLPRPGDDIELPCAESIVVLKARAVRHRLGKDPLVLADTTSNHTIEQMMALRHELGATEDID